MLISCSSEVKVNVEINGQVKNLEGVKVFVEQNGEIIDSTIIKNGRFYLKSSVSDNQLCTIDFRSTQPFMHKGFKVGGWRRAVDFFVEERSSYLIKANNKDEILSSKHQLISNSKNQHEYEDFNSMIQNGISDRKKELMEIEKKRELALLMNDDKAYDAYTEEVRVKEKNVHAGRNKIIHDFVIKNPNSYVSLYLLSEVSDLKQKVDFYRYIYEEINPDRLDHSYARIFEGRLERAEKKKKTSLNVKFNAKNKAGKPLNLADFKESKLIIFDFWATWRPERFEEIPASLKFEKEFAKLKVAYVFVSYDLDKSYWAKQSAEMGLTNSFLLDEKSKQVLKDELGITRIPRYVIMNPQGDILIGNAPSPSRLAMKELVKGLL